MAVNGALLHRAEAALQTQLNPIIHSRIRLGIVSALAAGENLSFTSLKQLLASSDGNLSVHARKLEDAGYIECHKSFHNRAPRTEYKLTDQGREALADYLQQMERIIKLARHPGTPQTFER